MSQIDFLISQNNPDSLYKKKKKIYFVISKNRICDIKKKKKFVVSQNLHNFLISQNNPDFLYHKFDFVISKHHLDFFISKNRFCDITKYEIFSTDEMMIPIKKKASAGVFPPIKMADRTCRLEAAIVCVHLKCACALIICGCCHFSKELKCKNYFVISQNQFLISQIGFWYQKFHFLISQNHFFYMYIYIKKESNDCDIKKSITKSNKWFGISKSCNDFFISQIRFWDITKSLF